MNILHETVGGLLLLAYLLAFILSFNKLELSRKLKVAGDVMLFLQYILGIVLLVGGKAHVHWHYVFALLPILLIPFAKKIGFRATVLLTFVFLVVAFLIGKRILVI